MSDQPAPGNGNGADDLPIDIAGLVGDATAALGESWEKSRRIASAFYRSAIAAPDALVALAETSEKVMTALPDALLALAEVSERMAVLAHQMERVNDSIDKASHRVDQAADGMRRATSGIRDIVDTLGGSIPEFSRAVGSFDTRLDHLDGVVSDLSRTIMSLLGVIPGVRRAIRQPEPPPPRSPIEIPRAQQG